METLDEYPFYCGEEKHIKAFFWSDETVQTYFFLEYGKTQNQILGTDMTSSNHWYWSKNKNILWVKEKMKSQVTYISSFPELSWTMGAIHRI